MPKIRLDVLLVERGLANSREQARALILAGAVRVAGRPVTKAGTAVPLDADGAVDRAALERARQVVPPEAFESRPEPDVAGGRVLHLDAAHALHHRDRIGDRPLEQVLPVQERAVQRPRREGLWCHRLSVASVPAVTCQDRPAARMSSTDNQLAAHSPNVVCGQPPGGLTGRNAARG